MTWGHDNAGLAGLTAAANGNPNTRVPQVWSVSENGTVGTVTLRLTKSAVPAGVNLLYVSSLSTFPNGSITLYPLTDDGTYLSTTLDLNDGEFFSFGAVFADLSLTKTASSSVVTQGNTFVYTLAVTNNGPSSVSGVVVTDSLPADVTFVSAIPNDYDSSAGLWTNINLGVGVSTNLQITVTASGDGLVVNSAMVVLNGESDTNTADNTSSAIIGIAGPENCTNGFDDDLMGMLMGLIPIARWLLPVPFLSLRLLRVFKTVSFLRLM